MPANFLMTFVRFLLIALEIAVLGRVLLSWIDPRGSSSLGQFLAGITEPILAPIRRVLPRSGMLDLAPLVLLLILGAVLRSFP